MKFYIDSFLLLRPITILFLLLWIGNDIWGKSYYPGFISGKLSDLTGLIVTPLFVGFVIFFIFDSLVKKIRITKFHSLILGILFTDIPFFFINWSQDWNDFVYSNFLKSPSGTADQTDFFCVPISWFALFLFYRNYEQKYDRSFFVKKSALFERLKLGSILALCIFALVNTSRIGESLVRIVHQDGVRNVSSGERIPVLFYTSCSLDGIELVLFKGTSFYKRQKIERNDLEDVNDVRTGLNLRRFEYVIPENFPPGTYYWGIRLLYAEAEFETVATRIHDAETKNGKNSESISSLRKKIKTQHEESPEIEDNESIRSPLPDCHYRDNFVGHNIHDSESVSSFRIWKVLR